MESGVRFVTAEDVGAELRRLRETAGWTQLDLAVALISDPSDRARAENKRTEISNWETGKTEPQGRTVFNILALLGALQDPPPGSGGLAEKVDLLLQRLDEAAAREQRVEEELRRRSDPQHAVEEPDSPEHTVRQPAR